MRHLFSLFAALCWVLSTLPLTAQETTYDLKAMPPADPKIKTGILPNGMRYYIRENRIPEKRGEFYIAHNVGAIQEEDDQNGLAHFTEHMAFNGTKNFPGKMILDYFANIGVKFGTNINAGTGLDRTVYNLSNVPLSRQGIVDTALLVLHDWSNYISFVPSEVDLERGVILEEWRMYGSANERMSNELAPVIYKGSKYATRNVIGDTAVIRHFKQETLTSFYHRWYRPDLQAVIVVGDFDAAVMEKQIIALFSSIPAAVNPVPKVAYPVPGNDEPLIGSASDPEATATMVNVYYKHDCTPDDKKTLGYMRIQLIRGLISTMFGQRMNEISNRENPPFLNARCYYSQFTRTKDAFMGLAQVSNNKAIPGLTALLTEMERIRKYGFTSGEFDRARADLMRNVESRYMDRDKRKNRELVMPVVSSFLANTPNPGIEFEYPFYQYLLPGISLEEVNREVAGYVTEKNQVITVTGPEKEGITLPVENEIFEVVMKCRTMEVEPYVDAFAGKKLMEKDPIPGKVVKSSTNTAMGTTEWHLSNGMKVILKPTDYKEDELLIQGYASGGESLLGQELLHPAELFTEVVSRMGVADFALTDLNKYLAGKRAGVTLWVGRDKDLVTAQTSPKDIETSLQLINRYFVAPRWDDTDFATIMEKIRARYVNAASNPRTAFSDSITVMMNDHNPRATPLTYDALGAITLEKIKMVHRERFSRPGNFTMIFIGRFDPETLKPLVEKYLASLPGNAKKESARNDGLHPPKGRKVNDFTRENKTPRSSVFVNLNGTCAYTPADKLYGAALRHVLELRYIKSIREDEGGAYSIRTAWALEKFPEPSWFLTVTFDTDPLKADKLAGIVTQEIDKIIASGPEENDLLKAREYFLKQRPEDMRENRWWGSILEDYYSYGLDYLNGFEEMVKKLDVPSVHAYAKKTLTQGNSVNVIMRPAESK